MTVQPTTNDKQITIDVPEDRVAEFYAFYGRFLAGSSGGRRRGPGPRGRRCGSDHGHPSHHHHHHHHDEDDVTAGPPSPENAGPEVAGG